MSEDSMLKCLIAFVLGYLVARMMRGNGLSVGGEILTMGHGDTSVTVDDDTNCTQDNECNGKMCFHATKTDFVRTRGRLRGYCGHYNV